MITKIIQLVRISVLKAVESLLHRKRIVLNPGWGGLGDALQYSTLPEQFWKQKKRRTYMYEGYKTRNSDVYDLVWGANPYVLGKSSGRPNAGDVATLSNKTGNFIANIEVSHGLRPASKTPVVYLEQGTLHRNAFILVDLSSSAISQSEFKNDNSRVSSYLQARFASEPESAFRRVTFSDPKIRDYNWLGGYPHLETLEEIQVASLAEYAGIILGACELIALHSGAVALASALKVDNTSLRISCLISESLSKSDRQVKDLIHKYEGVEYIVP